MRKVTNEKERADMVRQARAGGAEVEDRAAVYKVSGGLYAVESRTPYGAGFACARPPIATT